jgi:hypothetical protein
MVRNLVVEDRMALKINLKETGGEGISHTQFN